MLMSSLKTRIISAAVAIALVFLLYYFFETNGLKALTFIAVILSSFELANMLFYSEHSLVFKRFFQINVLGLFTLICFYPGFELIIFSITASVFIFYVLVIYKNSDSVHLGLDIIGRGILGFLYLGILPTFAYKLISFPGGKVLFVSLLLIVFSGDIGAYFIGSKFGKTKLMPAISPKKSFEGALGGLIFSLLSGYFVFNYLVYSGYLNQWWSSSFFNFLPFVILAAIFAQLGDFFESLFKRVANIKDSGSLMPGHGGVLDRIDGVLFAAPIIYLAYLMFLK